MGEDVYSINASVVECFVNINFLGSLCGIVIVGKPLWPHLIRIAW